MPSLRATSALLALLLLGACTQPGLPAGSVCTSGSNCASGLCRGAPSTVHHCVAYCQSNAECTAANEVCGRVDLRFTDVDTGLPVGDENEAVNVCRVRLNAACSTDSMCVLGGVCLGAPGVCTTSCTDSSQCPSTHCILPPVCGVPGQCAPLCDDPSECPRGYFCTQVATGTTVHGYCLDIFEAGIPATQCEAGLEGSTPSDAAAAMDASMTPDVAAIQ